MKTNHQFHGFTILELAVVLAIVAIMLALGFATLMPAQPRMRVRGDSENVNQALIKARMTTIAHNIPFGMAFYRTNSGDPRFPYRYHYFIFKDSVGATVCNPPTPCPDELFTDLDGDPLHQCETVGQDPPGGCTAGGEDPIWWSEGEVPDPLDPTTTIYRIVPRVMTLEKQNFFDTIQGTTLTNTPLFVIFKPPMGEATTGGDIIIQSNIRADANQNTSYAATISIIQATGVTMRSAPVLRTHP